MRPVSTNIGHYQSKPCKWKLQGGSKIQTLTWQMQHKLRCKPIRKWKHVWL